MSRRRAVSLFHRKELKPTFYRRENTPRIGCPWLHFAETSSLPKPDPRPSTCQESLERRRRPPRSFRPEKRQRTKRCSGCSPAAGREPVDRASLETVDPVRP